MENLNQTNNNKKQKFSVLNSIIAIYEDLENSKLAEEKISALSNKIQIVQDYLTCSKIQAVLFSLVFAIQHKSGSAVTLQMLTDYLGESLLYMIKYCKELNVLIEKDILVKGYNSEENSNSAYCVNRKVINNIIEDLPVDYSQDKLTTPEIIEEINEIITSAKDCRVTYDYTLQLKSIERTYKNNELIKNVTTAYPEDIEARIFIYNLCERLVSSTSISDDDDDSCSFEFKIFPSKSVYRMKKEISENRFHVIKDGYAKKSFNVFESGMLRHKEISCNYYLTQKGIDKFFGTESKDFEAEENSYSDIEKLKQFLLEFSKSYYTRRILQVKKKTLLQLETNASDLELVKKIKKAVPNDTDRFILYDCCNDFVNFNLPSNLTKTLQDIYGSDSEFYKKMHEYKEEKCFLLKKGFLILNKDTNLNKAELTISDKTIEYIYGDEANLFVQNIDDKNVIEPKKLKAKTLFYPDEIVSQMDMLAHSLENKNLIETQKRLEKKGLPKGVAVLLYGAAGTGKTESVYQLAKKTNRKVYHVDISESKSCWFGESEKRIKRIFTNYRNMCESYMRHKKNIPILLFNEADAIISKRKDVGSSNVAQTENAIQNIILEQMETLEGIMIATTNLCNNMDSAFERRFLFKIKFDKPGIKERLHIWKNKLPLLTDEEAKLLAGKFDFSGGEIDNIVRKCEIDEIINGELPELSKIEELCKNEKLSGSEARKVGFAV